jgi:RNA polymerase sigma factor (sigma-70 family)
MAAASTAELDAWIIKLSNADPEARNFLLTHTQNRLQEIVRRMFHGGFARLEAVVESMDVVQELNLRLIRDWDTAIAERSDRPLCAAADYFALSSRLVRNVLIDLSRKHWGRGANRPIAHPLDIEQCDASEAHPFDPGTETYDPAQVARFSEFHRAVQELPEKLREVMDLHWYHELPHKVVGEILGVAEITVRKRWVEARLELRRRFPDAPFD